MIVRAVRHSWMSNVAVAVRKVQSAVDCDG